MKKLMMVAAVAMAAVFAKADVAWDWWCGNRSEEHTSELQSRI